MLKRFLAILLCFVILCPILVSCSSTVETEDREEEREKNNNDEDDGNGSTHNSNTIKVGMSGPLTGAAAIYGEAVRNSAQLAVDEINADGGVNGYDLELIATDDAHDTKKVEANYVNMLDHGMQVSLGCVTSQPCLEFAELAKEDNLFFMTPTASNGDVTEYDNAYRMCYDDDGQGKAAADYINSLGFNKIGILYKADDSYSTGIYDRFMENIDSDIKIVEAAFTSANETDFSSQIDKLENCEFIFMPIYYTPAAIFMTQAVDRIADDVIYYGCDAFDGIEYTEGFDIYYIPQKVMMLSSFNVWATEGPTKEYIDNYTRDYGTDTLNQFGASAYDTVYALAEAMEGTDITPSSSPDEVCEMLKEVFQGGFTFSGVTGENMSWDEEGCVNKMPIAFIIKDYNY